MTFDHLICWKYLDILCTELGTFLPVDVKTCHWFMGNTKKRVNVQLRVICPWKRYFGRDRSAKILNFCWIFPSVTSFDILVENSRHGAIMSDIEWYWYWAEEPAVCWGQERGKESISCGRTSYSRSRLASQSAAVEILVGQSVLDKLWNYFRQSALDNQLRNFKWGLRFAISARQSTIQLLPPLLCSKEEKPPEPIVAIRRR